MSSAASPVNKKDALDLIFAQFIDGTKYVQSAPSAYDPALVPFMLPMSSMYMGAPKQPTAMPSVQVVTPAPTPVADDEFGEFVSATPKATAVVSTALNSAAAKAPTKKAAAASGSALPELNDVQMDIWAKLVAKGFATKDATMLVRKPINSEEERITRIATFQSGMKQRFSATEATKMVDALLPYLRVVSKK